MKSFLDACRMPEPLQLAVEAEGTHEAGMRLLHQPFALIGRDERADVPLDHRLVSRRHAYLQVVEGHVFWVDLESRLGTLGSGRPRKFGWLDVDEAMRIGPYEIRRLIGGRPIRRDAAHLPPPEAVPLAAKTYGPSPWPDVSLEFLNGPSRSAVWPMNRVLSLVGSAGGCKFRLADPSVSPFHCSLLRTSVGLWVVDLLGNDGVSVNNASVRYALLADGDLLKIGRYRIRVRSRFFDDELPFDHPGATAALPRPATSHVLSLRGPSAASSTADWSSGSPLAPLSLGPRVARTELLPSAGPPLYPTGMERSEVEASVLVPLVNQFGMMQQQMFDQFQNAMGMLVEMFGSLQREQMDVIRQELDQLREVTREFQEVKLELAAFTRERERERAQAEAAAAASASTAAPAPSAPPAESVVPGPRQEAKPSPAPAAPPRPVVTPGPYSTPPRSRATEAAAQAVPPRPSPVPPASPSKPSAAVNVPDAGVSSPPGSSAAAATTTTAAAATVASPGSKKPAAEGPENERDMMVWLNQRIVTLQNERESRWQKILKLLPGAS